MRNNYITHNASLFKPVKVELGKSNDDDDDLISENVNNQSAQNTNSDANQTRRYPARERRPLQRYIEHC